MALVEQAMTRESYASGTRVFWLVDHAVRAVAFDEPNYQAGVYRDVLLCR